jgi:hypothetical protein
MICSRVSAEGSGVAGAVGAAPAGRAIRRRQRPAATKRLLFVIIVEFLEKAAESGRLQRMRTGGKIFG